MMRVLVGRDASLFGQHGVLSAERLEEGQCCGTGREHLLMFPESLFRCRWTGKEEGLEWLMIMMEEKKNEEGIDKLGVH